VLLGWKNVIASCLAATFLLPLGSRASADAWQSPLKKTGYLGSPLVETTPFVFKNRLYLLENHQAFFDDPAAAPGANFANDAVRVRDVETGELVSVALKKHGFGTAFVWQDRVYVFASDYGTGKPWRHATEITLTTSADLKTWTAPQTVLRAENSEIIYNVAVCRGPERFVLLYETNDARWPAFTFKYCDSDDLVHWRRIPGALYGTRKYVGGPALYYEGDWYYTLYLESLGQGRYETRITRSKNLVDWHDAPAGRPFLTFDPAHKGLPRRPSDVAETNASDPELCYFRGKTIIYFTGGDQQVCGDLERAEFPGTPRELFERFFAPTEGVSRQTRRRAILRILASRVGFEYEHAPPRPLQSRGYSSRPASEPAGRYGARARGDRSRRRRWRVAPSFRA
jgi:alpha-L-fucosidase